MNELTAPEPSDEQKRTKVWQHPDRDAIHALLRRGKSAFWISAWLEELYPLEDEDGSDHPDILKHRRWQLTEKTIERYRKEFMPEVAPGVDVVDEGLEDLIGRRMPMPDGPGLEVELMETALIVAQQNLARALEQDEDMGMLQGTTLDAHTRFVDTIKSSASLKQQLNRPGYEAAPQHLVVDQTNKNFSVELHGRVDPRTGQIIPNEPEKLEALKQLLELGPGKAGELISAAEHAARATLAAAEAEAEASVAADLVVDAEIADGDEAHS